MLETKWVLKPCDLNIAKELAYELEIPLCISRVLVSRGIDSISKANDFVDLSLKKLHNPMSLPDAQIVIERISKAIDLQEKIFVWGDYDVDGITSTAIVVTALKKMEANLEYKVPHRMEDGYDIKVHSVDEAIEREAKLLISVDCGIVAFETAAYAKKRGLDLIITDHHHPSDDGKIPDCIGVVNPNRDDPNYPGEHFKNDEFKRYPFDALAGCGIAFKLMLGLAKYRKMSVVPFIDELIEYAALGTVADVAPMFDENRVIVNHGCSMLTNSRKPGVRELLRIAGVKDVTPTTIGFQIGPRINAIGRLADAGTALNLMLAEDDITASMLANQLNNANIKRQQQQEENTLKAIEIVEKTVDFENEHIIVIGDKNWHPGLIGLIAGKVAELFHKPALVCSFKDDGYAKGSCRSVRDFNILDALKSEKAWALFKKRADGSTVCGGHAFAAGFELAIDNLPAMRQALNDYARSIVGEVIKEKIIEVDSKIQFHDLNQKTYNHLLKISPFGGGNVNPLFVTQNAKILEIKSISNGKHCKLKFTDGDGLYISANAWRRGHYSKEFQVNDIVDLVFTMEIDTFTGRNNLILIIEDMKHSSM
jgi:single-stranded-DNA-specific exonuclease